MKKAISLGILALAISACQPNRNNDPVENTRQAAKDRDLQKAFESKCSFEPIDAVVSGLMTEGKAFVKSQTVTYRFDGANVIRQTRLYTSKDCSGEASLMFEEAGTISIGSDARTADGARQIEMDFKSLEATVSSEDDAKAANEAKLCGVTDWSAGKSRDVINHSKDVLCYNAEIPRHVSNIYRVDNGTLYLGTLTKASVAAEDRPKSLDKATEFKAK